MAKLLTEDFLYPASYDQTQQPARGLAAKNPNRPLLVSLHPWSWGYRHLDSPAVEQWCVENDWNLVHPHFRGPSWEPLSCGHDAAVQDIVDVVKYVQAAWNVDVANTFCTGCSGGGYHTMLMTGRHPELWKGTSAWCGISDIKAWHAESRLRKYGYNNHIETACGGDPQIDAAAEASAVHRSALTYLQPNNPVPSIEIAAGIHDGHQGSVPISHSLNAFNALVLPEDRIAQNDIDMMTEFEQVPSSLPKSFMDPDFGKQTIHFRKQVDNVRVTIFEGGHEMVQSAVIAWLQRMTE